MSEQAGGVDDKSIITDQPVPSSQQDMEQARAAAEFGEEAKNGQRSMLVRIHSPYREYYDGQAFSLTAENATGPFDVLPGHHNFISLLLPCELIVRTVEEGERKIIISGGLLHVKADKVVVFLDV
jgi:ATP synthase, Delta/Epsilon chain, beta-sandwich domain